MNLTPGGYTHQLFEALVLFMAICIAVRLAYNLLAPIAPLAAVLLVLFVIFRLMLGRWRR